MVVAVLPFSLFSVETGAGSHIHLAADDGPDPLFPAGLVEINDAVHNAVVRYGRGVHAKLLYSFNVFADLVGSVQKGILRMYMKMRKCHALPHRKEGPFRMASARGRSSCVVTLILL